jgi:drug/metabolite transporter (DMT)-like permease
VTPISLLVLLAAALLHAGWNLLVKQAADKQAFTGLALLAGALLATPVLVLGFPFPARLWPYALASAFCEALYFAALATAYRLADFSLAYPIARGTAPLLLALWAVWWLGERPSLGGMIGLSILVLGLLVVGAAGRPHPPPEEGRQAAKEGSRWAGIAAALAVAMIVSVYSVIDGAAVRFAAPAPYTALVLALAAPLIMPVVLFRSSLQTLRTTWRLHWPRILLVGALMQISYGLVLFAYSRSPVSYAGAIREVSIIFAALAGWRWLHEPLGRQRLAGAVLICGGILLIAVAG